MADQDTAAPFRLHLFATLDTSQSNHGIPHQDYVEYHRYCTARLHRLRRVDAVKRQLVSNFKYAEGVSGRRHAYCAREIPDVTHENVLWNLFYQAERAWAESCANSGHYSTRRLKKAQKWAALLSEHCKIACVEETVVECRSYDAWQTANVALQQKDYQKAFASYKESMDLLLELAARECDSSPEALARVDLWTTRADQVLLPLVRFCGHEAKVDPSEYETKHASRAVTSDSIMLSFRGQDVALDSYTQLAVLYLKLDLQKSKRTEAEFLQLFSDLNTALGLIQDEYRHYESLPAGPSVTAKREELKTISAFFEYQKLSVWRQQQELRMVEMTTDDDAEMIHLYDTLLQNATATADLFQDEDDPLWLQIQAHIVRMRAHRCYYLARLYESTGSPLQVIALLKQAQKLQQRAIEEIAACDDLEGANDYLQALDDLTPKLRAVRCRVEATMYLASKDEADTKTTDRPLWLRLDDLDAGPVLADNPPLYIAAPCKPTFFDLAYQHLGEPPVQDIDKFIEENEPKKGFLSWFR